MDQQKVTIVNGGEENVENLPEAVPEKDQQVEVDEIEKEQVNQMQEPPMVQAQQVPVEQQQQTLQQQQQQPMQQQVQQDKPYSAAYSPEASENAGTSPRNTGMKMNTGLAGYNFAPTSEGEVMGILRIVSVVRFVQVVLALISFACGASLVSELNSIAFISYNLPPINWAITVGVFVFIYAAVLGILGFVLAAGNGSEPMVTGFTRAGLALDAIFAFLTFSGFSTAAAVSTSGNSGKAGAQAAFLFFTWMTIMYTVPHSFVLMRQAELLRNGSSRNQYPPAFPQQQQQPPVVVNV